MVDSHIDQGVVAAESSTRLKSESQNLGAYD